MTTYRTIDVAVRDGLCIVTQNRPERLNARNSQMYAEIIAALEAASADDAVAAVLLASRGRAFCAGMDFRNEHEHAYTALPGDSERVRRVKAQWSADDPIGAVVGLAGRFVAAFVEFDKPLFAAVQGGAIGEGFTSLLHCDVVYASPDAYFWAPFARAGVAPEFCSTVLAPRRLGATLAHAALYLALRISAEEARDAGFVLEIVAADDFAGAVEARVQEGLALAGPPELRGPTLRSYRALVRPEEERKALLAQADREFALVRARVDRGETERVRAYYAAHLPGTGAARE